MRRAFAVLALVATIGLAGCGDDEPPPVDDGDPPTKTIDITIEGADISPSGDRVEVELGQPIELVVMADAEGEIHVHTDPEQELEYAEGTTTLKPFTIDKPGVVDVESHALDKTIVQLEVE